MQARVFPSDGAGQMQFSILASSAGRMWKGFEASVYDVSAGISERPPNAAYSVVMHLSSAVEGTCRCEGPLMRRIIKPGDIDFVPLGCAATWHDKGAGRVANVRISSTLMRRTAAAMGHSGAESVTFPSRLSLNDPVLKHLVLAMVAELQNSDGGSLLAESIGSAIATHLLQRYASLRAKSGPRRLSPRQLSRVVEYIDANVATNLSLAEIAAVAGISPSHLKALFKQSAGVPVHQYVIQRRVEYAVRLLSLEGARLCDVAQQAGFADQSHMSRCMRRVNGMTPAALLRDIRR
jgi:AraC family transcriptional regulator